MNLLFSAGYLETQLNANSKIAITLATECAKHGHHCIVAGISREHEEDTFEMGTPSFCYLTAKGPESRAFISYHAFKKKHKRFPFSSLPKFILLHPIYSASMLFYKLGPSRRKHALPWYAAVYQRKIRELCEQKNVDAVLFFSKPYWHTHVLMHDQELRCSKYIYELDPYSLHRLEASTLPMQTFRTKQEVQLFSRASHVFTTPILKESYTHIAEYRTLLPRITALEFPAVQCHSFLGESAIVFDSHYTNILFTGICEDIYRSPKPLLTALLSIMDAVNWRVYFLGALESPSVVALMKEHPSRIFSFPQVEVQTAFATMKQADILLNIGNTVDNMIPSKIFDYFSTGKPLLHIKKIPNCPSMPYITQYPLSYVFDEQDPNNLLPLQKWIKTHKNKTVLYEDVAKIFKTATPEYVGQKLLSILTQQDDFS